eukprot:CAMPEP_0172321424 /NCGR_PEP_ID=MMETSP1058-20130122/43353_1 /TAXON_ID=83371 /ORGANISM="Detonula confervacea, Strain CCMP 353" /LENGTH=326 /DNA_ID=CAMNT_0013036931 /DNA_START=15 /DNA_END=995 /DNA_ORIENTATION=+
MSFSYGHDGEEPSNTYNITGVAISNKTIIILSTLGFGALGLALFLILRRLSTIDGHDEQQEHERGRDVYGEQLDQSDVATLNRAQRRARAKFRMKKARRAAVPGQQEVNGEDDEGGAAQALGGDEVMGEDFGGINDLGEANLTRKERQKAAKAREREERKIYAEEARLWREKKQSTIKSEGSNCDGKEKKVESSHEANELSFEEIYPRSANENDALSDHLFWESIAKNTKQTTNSPDEIISIAQHMPKMTIGEFVERLKRNGSVSIATLADEFGISVPEALGELDNINKQHGIIGIVDASGSFVYVSIDMIKAAIKLGQDAGINHR